ncbi:MAG: hypothetical protein HRU19_20380 [Pseudobacteriovorax sp.]|nr:hypothetical protein [Pseudobacteriovorax sp.]
MKLLCRGLRTGQFLCLLVLLSSLASPRAFAKRVLSPSASQSIYHFMLTQSDVEVSDDLWLSADFLSLQRLTDHVLGLTCDFGFAFSERTGLNEISQTTYRCYAQTRKFCEVNISPGDVEDYLKLPFPSESCDDFRPLGSVGVGTLRVGFGSEVGDIAEYIDGLRSTYPLETALSLTVHPAVKRY